MAASELKLLLALNGNRRIEHLEEEIFADRVLAELYLTSLCKSYSWYDTSSPVSELAYIYVAEVIGGPWPAAEPIILSTAEDAYYYARYVTRDRWLAAEPIIKSDAHYWYIYRTWFGII